MRGKSPSLLYTIGRTALATAVATGATNITASLNGTNGVVVSNVATVTVSVGLVSISIIPPASPVQVLTNSGETSQFIAIGTYSGTPTTLDITNQVTWVSSDIGVATIDSAGLATAGIVAGQTTITAIATSTSGATITGTSLLDTNGVGGGQLPTLAIYAVGLGTGKVTSSPAGINCISGAGCTGNFPLNTVVTLTAVADPTNPAPLGSQVGPGGGWSSNCTPVLPIDPTLKSSSCTITMSTNAAGQPANEAVGVIFNLNP